MTTASKEAYIKSEVKRIGVKRHIENYMKVTGYELTSEELHQGLNFDRYNTQKRMSELELEGKLKIIGERAGFSIYKYEPGASKMTKTDAWQFAVMHLCPERFHEVFELYNKMKR